MEEIEFIAKIFIRHLTNETDEIREAQEFAFMELLKGRMGRVN